jgi:hypothetical protein
MDKAHIIVLLNDVTLSLQYTCSSVWPSIEALGWVYTFTQYHYAGQGPNGSLLKQTRQLYQHIDPFWFALKGFIFMQRLVQLR